MMSARTPVVIPIIVLALLETLLAACGGDDKALSITDRSAAKPAAEKAGTPGTTSGSALAAEAVRAEEAVFAYDDSSTYRDPFHSYLTEFEKKAEGATAEEIARAPTEAYDIGSFRVIGIITGTPVPKAMVIDPTGYGHVIRPGDRIGKQGGRVVAIYSNEVVIQAALPMQRETILYLNAPGQQQESYQVNVVESGIEAEAARQGAAQKLLRQLDLQQLLGGGAPSTAGAAAEGATGGAGPDARTGSHEGGSSAASKDLPAIPIVPLFPGYMVPATGGGMGTGLAPGSERSVPEAIP
jgi:hypothetical protein